jgi:hypothetical protein
MKKVVTFVLVVNLLGFSPTHSLQRSTKNPKAGQFCAVKEAGLKISGLVCKKVGTRYRWSH